MSTTKSMIYSCFHCGNDTPHSAVAEHTATLLYEQFREERFHEPFDYFMFSCGTCGGLTLLGSFRHERHSDVSALPRLYPTGSSLAPQPHLLGVKNPIPFKIVQVYEEAWPLRRKNPNAFANQIRRALEYVCEDRGAQGKNLASKLRDLESLSVFPVTLAELATQIRIVGNIGSHADNEDIDIWDAELVDEFFRMVLDYVYLVPSKLERMKQRLGRNTT